MKYTESSNELILGNAVPISDEEGKQIEDSEKIFDFTLNMNITGDFQVAYEVAVEKDNTSTLEDKYVKLYLERSLDGANYEEVMEPTVYTPIKEKSQFGAPAGSMILDTGIVNKSTKYYYRLRMWVDSSYTKVEAGETYEVKINSYGTTEKNTMDENKPVCTFGEYKELKINETSTVELICIDNTVGIEKKELLIADFVNSNKELGEILEVSKAEKIANGYKYMLTLKGLSTGKFKIELPRDIIVDKLGNSNEAVSKEIEVKGLTYKVNYIKSSNAVNMDKTTDSCTTTGTNTSCQIELQNITNNKDYNFLGYYSDSTYKNKVGGMSDKYILNKDIILYDNWTPNCKVTITEYSIKPSLSLNTSCTDADSEIIKYEYSMDSGNTYESSSKVYSTNSIRISNIIVRTTDLIGNVSLYKVDNDSKKKTYAALISLVNDKADKINKNNYLNSYPIGSIYISINNINPGTIYGGTWEAFGKGKTLIGVDTSNSLFNVVNKTGGSSAVKLTKNQVPSLSATGTTNNTGNGYSINYTYSNRTTSSNNIGNLTFYYSNNYAGNSSALGSFMGSAIYSNTLGTANSFASHAAGGTHSHTTPDYYVNSISGVMAHSHTFTGNYTNSSQSSISIQNPYITTYMWKRLS